MFGIINYKLFLLSAILLILTPGLDTFYVLGRGTGQGKKAGVLSAIGVSTGCFVHTLLAAFGLSSILQTSIVLFNFIKTIGAIYLIFLGINSIMSKDSENNIKNSNTDISLKKIFLQGILTNILNPKVALFFLAFLPQFVNQNSGFGPIPFMILGLTHVTLGGLWLVVVGLSSSFIAEKFKKQNKFSSLLNKTVGILFISLGIKLFKTKISN